MLNIMTHDTKQLQTKLDQINAVFEANLFQINSNLNEISPIDIHLLMLRKSRQLNIQNNFDMSNLIPLRLDNSFITACNDSNESANLTNNWFKALNEALFDPPYGTKLKMEEYRHFFKTFCISTFLTEPDCEILDWVGCNGSGRDDCSDWNTYFELGREWWGNWCLTIYAHNINKGCVLLASTTD